MTRQILGLLKTPQNSSFLFCLGTKRGQSPRQKNDYEMNGNGFCGTPRQTQSSPALLHLTFGEFLETAGRSKA